MMKKKSLALFISLLFSCFSCAPIPSKGKIEPTPVDPPEEKETTINIVAFNDFHGAVEASGNNIGLANFGTYLKKKSEEKNTLILDQGDTWQGSIYSNYNHGNLINDVWAYAHVSARTVGNHDFDWGVDKLKINTIREYEGYVTPVLAANIYDYDFPNRQKGNTQQEDIGKKSVTYTLDNGLKVGIVGIIGKDQITSITSTNTLDIYFKDHIPVLVEEATSLRENGCDVVIASCHTGQESLVGNNLSNYFDLVLCGHTHQSEISKENGMTYAQFGSYGTELGDIQLTYSYEDKKVINTTVKEIYGNDVKEYIGGTADPKITQLISQYNSECDEAANEIVASNVSGYFDRNEAACNLMCKAITEQAIEEGFNDIIFSFCNESRSSIYSRTGSWNYANLYQAFPFDNIIYIVEVTGKDIIDEVFNWNNVCYNPSFDYKIDKNKTYKIAVIDFLIYHMNVNKEFDFFPSFTGNPIGHLNDNYRVILKNWLSKNGYKNGKELNSYDFSSDQDQFNKRLMQEVQ